MKVATFFKTLNKKIEMYDKLASNPFTKPQPIVIIWVEQNDKDNATNNDNKKAEE